MKRKEGQKLNKILVFVICLVLVYIASIAGSFFTSKTIASGWYDSIKPSITPPNWVFPVVWNILFVLIAVSLYFAWTSSRSKKSRITIAIVFLVNLALNVLWSVFFFSMRNPLLGFFDLLVLWFSIVIMMASLWKISRTSVYLLVPYLAWVSFAGVINFLAI